MNDLYLYEVGNTAMAEVMAEIEFSTDFQKQSC